MNLYRILPCRQIPCGIAFAEIVGSNKGKLYKDFFPIGEGCIGYSPAPKGCRVKSRVAYKYFRRLRRIFRFFITRERAKYRL